MADLDCRIVAMLGLALSLLSLSGVIFVRHHHNAYHNAVDAFAMERENDYNAAVKEWEAQSTTSTSDDDGTTNPPTDLITTIMPNNETTPQAFEVSEACLQCICEASTGCLPAKCAGGLDCGIFRISRGYWIDAGSPTLKGGIYQDQAGIDAKKAYLQCVTNPFCAARTVNGYIDRYIRDCDNDGMIDCYDYAAIHIQGPTGCKVEELSPMTFGRLYRCLNDLTVKTKAP